MTRGDLVGLALVLVTALIGLGWLALRGFDGQQALDDGAGGGHPELHTLESRREPAIQVAPEQPNPHAQLSAQLHGLNRDAIEALELGDFARAIELFERCHAEAPDEPTFAANLAEALARLARREHEERETTDQAIERLARAVGLAPQREDLAAELARWREVAEVEAGFWREESSHFHLAYDGARADLLHRGHRALLDGAESAYLEFGELFGLFPVEEGSAKLQIVVYRRAEFRALTGIGDWAGGAFDGVVRIPLEDLDRDPAGLKRVLRHELVHAFVREVGGPRVPGWINEGLAQWLEEASPSARASQVTRARRRLAGKALLPLDSLQGSLASWTDDEAISVAYAQSLALVDHLAQQYGERVVFRMIAGCADGTQAAETFRARVQVDLAVVVQDLADGL